MDYFVWVSYFTTKFHVLLDLKVNLDKQPFIVISLRLITQNKQELSLQDKKTQICYAKQKARKGKVLDSEKFSD